MFRRDALRMVGGLVLGGSLAATAAADGDPSMDDRESGPGGPWLTDEERRNLSGFHDYEQLVERLHAIEQSGPVSLETIGTSNQGRDIYMATAGRGDTDVMLCSQQHGHEPTGTETLVRLLNRFGGGENGGPFGDVLDELTIHAIVRANPDGSEPDVFHRFNVDPEAPFRDPGAGKYTDYSEAGTGWDLNRYHWFDWEESPLYAYDPDAYPENPVPEAQAIVDVVDEVEPLWFVDMHNQLSYVTDDSDLVTNSVLWPLNDDVPEKTRDLGRQLCWLAYDEAKRFGNSTPTRFPGGGSLGTARNSQGVEGVASILLEARGHIGQKSMGQLVRNEMAILEALLKATADGSVFDVDPALADDIPERGNQYHGDLPRGRIHEDEWVHSQVSTALLDWDMLNDVVAISVDGRFLERLPVDVGDNVLVHNPLTDQVRPFYVARTHDDGGDRTLRTGLNGRRRFYASGDDVPSQWAAEVRGQDLGEWYLTQVRLGQSQWDFVSDEGFCGVEESFAEVLGVETGDEVVVQSHETSLEATYEVGTTYGPDEVDNGERRIRMGFAARSRLYEDDTPSEFVGQVKPA